MTQANIKGNSFRLDGIDISASECVVDIGTGKCDTCSSTKGFATGTATATATRRRGSSTVRVTGGRLKFTTVILIKELTSATGDCVIRA